MERTEPEDFDNRSLVKYRIIIEDFGGWASYQELLQLLKSISSHYGCEIANISSAYILQKEAVGAVIVGTTEQQAY